MPNQSNLPPSVNQAAEICAPLNPYEPRAAPPLALLAPNNFPTRAPLFQAAVSDPSEGRFASTTTRPTHFDTPPPLEKSITFPQGYSQKSSFDSDKLTVAITNVDRTQDDSTESDAQRSYRLLRCENTILLERIDRDTRERNDDIAEVQRTNRIEIRALDSTIQSHKIQNAEMEQKVIRFENDILCLRQHLQDAQAAGAHHEDQVRRMEVTFIT